MFNNTFGLPYRLDGTAQQAMLEYHDVERGDTPRGSNEVTRDTAVVAPMGPPAIPPRPRNGDIASSERPRVLLTPELLLLLRDREQQEQPDSLIIPSSNELRSPRYTPGRDLVISSTAENEERRMREIEVFVEREVGHALDQAVVSERQRRGAREGVYDGPGQLYEGPTEAAEYVDTSVEGVEVRVTPRRQHETAINMPMDIEDTPTLNHAHSYHGYSRMPSPGTHSPAVTSTTPPMRAGIPPPPHSHSQAWPEHAGPGIYTTGLNDEEMEHAEVGDFLPGSSQHAGPGMYTTGLNDPGISLLNLEEIDSVDLWTSNPTMEQLDDRLDDLQTTQQRLLDEVEDELLGIGVEPDSTTGIPEHVPYSRSPSVPSTDSELEGLLSAASQDSLSESSSESGSESESESESSEDDVIHPPLVQPESAGEVSRGGYRGAGEESQSREDNIVISDIDVD